MEPFRNTIPELFDAALEMGLRFYGAPYLFSTSDAKADASGVVTYAGNDGEADMAIWKRCSALAWPGRRPYSSRDEPARDRYVRTGSVARGCEPGARVDIPITTHMAQSAGEVATIAQRYDGRTRPNISIGSACLVPICWPRIATPRPMRTLR